MNTSAQTGPLGPGRRRPASAWGPAADAVIAAPPRGAAWGVLSAGPVAVDAFARGTAIGRELEIAHVDGHHVHRALEQRATEPVAGGQRLLGEVLLARLEHARAHRQRCAEAASARGAWGDERARIARHALDLARAALRSHVYSTVGERRPHGGGDGRAVPAEGGHERVALARELRERSRGGHARLPARRAPQPPPPPLPP